MFKKILLYLFFALLFCFKVNAQINGHATYGVKITDTVYFQKMLKISNSQSYISDIDISGIELKLLFDENKSVFYNPNFNMKSKLLFVDNFFTNTAVKRYTLKKEAIQYFYSFKSGMFKENEYKITNKLDTIWNIQTDFKLINNYKCYKATQLKSKNLITVWFCPEFPYPFGPRYSGGLPGLIFEYNDEKQQIYLKNIKFDKVKLDFNEPIYEKEITGEEFNIIVNKFLKDVEIDTKKLIKQNTKN